jgi:hypothetical protein
LTQEPVLHHHRQRNSHRWRNNSQHRRRKWLLVAVCSASYRTLPLQNWSWRIGWIGKRNGPTAASWICNKETYHDMWMCTVHCSHVDNLYARSPLGTFVLIKPTTPGIELETYQHISIPTYIPKGSGPTSCS